MKEKDLLIQYVKIINKYNEKIKNGETVHLLSDEEVIVKRIKEIADSDGEFRILVDRISQLHPHDRELVLNEFFDEKTESSQKEEEVIAQTFGVDATKIAHKLLDNGKEVFSFYDSKLGKEILLENDKNGKPLIEQLKEIQAENEKYQSSDEETNANDILRDKRNHEHLELQFLSKEEIDGSSLGKSMSEVDYKKLQYLLDHYQEYHIQGINLENMIYLDDNHVLHEVVINSKNDIAVAIPDSVVSAHNESSYESIGSEDEDSNDEIIPGEVEEDSFESLDDEIKEQVIFYYENPQELDKIESEDERDRMKHYLELYQKSLEKKNDMNFSKVYKKKDKYGFVEHVFSISIIIFMLLAIMGIVLHFVNLG